MDLDVHGISLCWVSGQLDYGHLDCSLQTDNN
jgi:hypothetical protein